MSSRARRLVVALLAAAVALGGVPAAAGPVDPVVGASGIGDPYFPLDGNGGIDVRRYDVDVAYDFATGVLRGSTRVRLRATADLSRFNLDLLLPVRAVRVDGDAVRWRKRGEHELQVWPDRPLRRGDVATVLVRYAGRPGRVEWRGERNWLADADEVVAMNQPHMAPWWFPANDHPRDKALLDVAVTVPADRQVVGNGRLVSRRVHGQQATTRWRAGEPMAPYLAFFAAGRFRVDRGTHDGLPWYVAVSRALPDEAERRAMALMRRTPAVVEWTERQLGRYPFDSTGGLTTALDPGFALENQTRPTYPSLDEHSGLPTLVHEVAHQWFGDSVSVERWRDIWLNEGFATYAEWLYDAARYSRPRVPHSQFRFLYRIYGPNAAFWKLAPGDPGSVGRLFATPIYDRGAMTLHALRLRVGDRAFFTILRRWARQNAYGSVGTRDFVRLSERVSGKPLKRLFRVWLYVPEKPAGY